jgi:hypothetical protein
VPDLFCAEETTAVPLGMERILVSGRLLRKSHFVVPEDVALLSMCTIPRTLKQHAHLAATLLGLDGQAAAIEARLSDLAQRGLLIRSRDLKKIWTESVELKRCPSPPQAMVCGIPTRSRKVAVGRALRSFIANASACRHDVRFVVSEDGLAPVDSIPDGLGATVRAADRDTRRRYAKELAACAAVDPDIVDFGLCAPDSETNRLGANRNFLLLLNKNTSLVFVDDDVVCDLAQWRGRERRTTFSGVGDPTEFILCASSRAAEEAVERVEGDFFGWHHSYLGQEVLQFFGNGNAGGSDCSQLTPQWVRSAVREPARVVCTSVGVVGDLATDSPAPWLLRDTDPSGGRGPRHSRYEELRLSRYGVRLASNVSIGRPVLSHGYSFGVDAGAALPPFVPIGRHEDCLFGTMVSALAPSACFCYLPVAVSHAPIDARRFPADALSGPPSLTVGGVLTALVSTVKFHDSLVTTDRLLWLGRHLSSLGSMRAIDFEDQLFTALAGQWSMDISNLENLLSLQNGRQDPGWERDIRTQIKVRERLVMAHAIPQLSDSPGLGGHTDEARYALQKVIRNFGDLLGVWEALSEAAERVNSHYEVHMVKASTADM